MTNANYNYIIYFYDKNCSTCLETDNSIKEMLSETNQHLRAIYVDVENHNNTSIVKKYNVNSVPLIVITSEDFLELRRFNISTIEDVEEIKKVVLKNTTF